MIPAHFLSIHCLIYQLPVVVHCFLRFIGFRVLIGVCVTFAFSLNLY